MRRAICAASRGLTSHARTSGLSPPNAFVQYQRTIAPSSPAPPRACTSCTFFSTESAGGRAQGSPEAVHVSLPEGPGLDHFLRQAARDGASATTSSGLSAAPSSAQPGARRHVYLETYGCQMNVNDSEVLLAVLQQDGYHRTDDIHGADLILVNTCAIRENAESKIWHRLRYFRSLAKPGAAGQRRAGPDRTPAAASIPPVPAPPPATTSASPPAAVARPGARPLVGILGCMAERLKEKLLEENRLVDLVVGPDAYRDVPRLVRILQGTEGEEQPPPQHQPASHPQGQEQQPGQLPEGANRAGRARARRRVATGCHSSGGAINVQLSAEETYADIMPVRAAGVVTAFLSVMRGCNNMCAFCIVPFTRGRERSRPVASVLEEVRTLSQQGFKEVTLLGQNVNSYSDGSERPQNPAPAGGAGVGDPFAVYARGFQSVYKPRRDEAVRFAELLARAAEVDPEMRIRFTSPHPKDFPDEVLEAIAAHPNICNQVHMPAQSGSSSVLHRMRRGYSREAYLDLVEHLRARLPGVALSSDFITGFCSESEQEHQDTCSLLRAVGYDVAYLFAYSERGKTHAQRHLPDDVPEDVKVRRLQDLNSIYREMLEAKTRAEIGAVHLVLVEGHARKAGTGLAGRTDTNRRVIVPDSPVPATYAPGPGPRAGGPDVDMRPGDYVAVQIVSGTTATLHGRVLGRTTLQEFHRHHGACHVAPLHPHAPLQEATL